MVVTRMYRDNSRGGFYISFGDKEATGCAEGKSRSPLDRADSEELAVFVWEKRWGWVHWRRYESPDDTVQGEDDTTPWS